MIHWHCTHPQLKVGGRLMLHNSSVNAVRILCDFLLTDPNYRLPASDTSSGAASRSPAARRSACCGTDAAGRITMR